MCRSFKATSSSGTHLHPICLDAIRICCRARERSTNTANQLGTQKQVPVALLVSAVEESLEKVAVGSNFVLLLGLKRVLFTETPKKYEQKEETTHSR